MVLRWSSMMARRTGPMMLGDLHRWMQVIGHDGRLQHEASDPVEVPKYGTAAQPR